MFIFQLAQEAYACEEKEEKLVTDAVKHLTEANYQIKDLYDQFTVKVTTNILWQTIRSRTSTISSLSR
jgi:hypothetical protein